jgi:acid phosphatase type 7
MARWLEAWTVPHRGVRFLVCAALACVSLLAVLLGEEARAATVEVEAEAMTLSGSSAVVVHSSSVASGGQDLAFYSNGSATSTFDGAPTNITLRARGKACQGNPHLNVYVDGAQKGTVEITSSTFADYALPLETLSAGTHTLRVAYEDDYHSPFFCDRNAYVDNYVLALSDAQQPQSDDPVLVGAGKIGACDTLGDEDTARLLDGIPGTVFTAGDNAFSDGTVAQFQDCYDPTWGRHKARTMPAPGKHDYDTVGASGYFGYFGATAGAPAKGYYSYDRGVWHIVSLNSMCEKVGGCEATSPMLTWLEQDLAANPRACTLAYFNHSLFSSGHHGNQTKVRPIWDVLHAANADVVMNGRDHDYERFAPQDPSGAADPARGIREFVVGTGGAHHVPFETVQPNSEVRNANTYGVLKLTLHQSSYEWQFVPVEGQTFTDSGTTNCH